MKGDFFLRRASVEEDFLDPRRRYSTVRERIREKTLIRHLPHGGIVVYDYFLGCYVVWWREHQYHADCD